MVVLDVDHPDIEEFIETKAREEDEDPRPARRRVRHGPRRQGHHQRPVPERQQLGPRLRRVHARGRERRGSSACAPARPARSSRRSTRRSSSARSPRPRGRAPTRASSTTTRSTTGTPTPRSGRITASQPVLASTCRLDNSSCNLASINLLKFLTGRRHLRCGAVRQGDDRADHHRDGHLDLLRRLPDREDRRDHPRLPPARHRLRQPWRAADGERSRLRLRRWPGHRRRRSPR